MRITRSTSLPFSLKEGRLEGAYVVGGGYKVLSARAGECVSAVSCGHDVTAGVYGLVSASSKI